MPPLPYQCSSLRIHCPTGGLTPQQLTFNATSNSSALLLQSAVGLIAFLMAVCSCSDCQRKHNFVQSTTSFTAIGICSCWPAMMVTDAKGSHSSRKCLPAGQQDRGQMWPEATIFWHTLTKRNSIARCLGMVFKLKRSLERLADGAFSWPIVSGNLGSGTCRVQW